MPVHPLPYPANEAAFVTALARELPEVAWLDSGAGYGRYSIVAADPRVLISSQHGQAWRRERGTSSYRVVEDPILCLRRELAAGEAEGPPPFAGGGIGYFGYDLGERWAGIERQAPSAMSEMAVGVYDWAVVRDHRYGTSWLAGPAANPDLAAWLRERHQSQPPRGRYRVGEPSVDLGNAAYAQAFDRLRQYIREGDCYQVNLARCFSAPFEGDALAAYRHLRQYSPSPYGAYLALGQGEVLSLSPERFLTLRDGRVETRPIKGTRPAEAEPAELAASEKDAAELHMIVDLLRNDLGRVCDYGSVQVTQPRTIESHPTVHHGVASVTGRLHQSKDVFDLLKASLPGGSVTGAPKVRAMEIIEELEPVRRGPYCGAIGWLQAGRGQLNIAIRTMLVEQNADGRGRVDYSVGGGIVADSDPAAEHQETLDKAQAMERALKGAAPRFGGLAAW